MATPHALDQVRAHLSGAPQPRLVAGADGLLAVATHPDVDIVLCASSGTAALEAVLAAIDAGKTIALANKEVLVMAGRHRHGRGRAEGRGRFCPVDSEHNAIHQCLHGRSHGEVTRLILTASGGPFRSHSAAELKKVGPEDALRHPTWRMGRKITIDSATLMNKGLEVIEARWLFDVGADQIDVVIHPQSVVHSMVEFRDGSVIAQLGVDRHAPAHSVRVLVPGPLGSGLPPPRSRSMRPARFRRAGPPPVSVPRPGLPRTGRGLGSAAGRPERGQRSRRGRLPRRAARASSSIAEVIERAMDAHRPGT